MNRGPQPQATTSPDTATALAIRVSLALAEHHSPNSPVLVSSAAAFCSGELSCWSTWDDDELELADQRRIGGLLRRRPRVLAEPYGFTQALAEADAQGQIPEYSFDPEYALARPRHGRCPSELAAELTDTLAAAPVRPSLERPRLPAGPSQVWAGDRQYSLDLPTAPPLPPASRSCVVPSPSVETLTVTRDELIATAEKLADAGRGQHLLRVGPLLDQLLDGNGEPSPNLDLKVGPTQLMVAPTGSGKSVLLRLLAVHLAASGRTAALVVPHTPLVVRLTREIEGDLLALGSGATVAGVVSPDSAMRHVAARLADPDGDDAETDWLMRRWTYACALAGAVTDPVIWPTGKEPCRTCPFQEGCAKFAEQRRAVTASVVVTNQDNFVAGRLRLLVDVAPVMSGNDAENHLPGDTVSEPRMPISQLLLLRSDVICIDEIDQFQRTVATHASSRLPLTRGRRLTEPLRRLRDQADAAIGSSLPEHAERRFRAAWANLDFLTGRYATACSGELGAFDPKGRPRRQLVLPGRHDPVIALRLAGRPENDDVSPADLAVLHGLDDPLQADLPSDLARVAQLLRSVVSAADGEDQLPAAQAGLLEALDGRIPDQRRRANTVDLLLHRAFLRGLQQAIRQLAALLGDLREAGVSASNEIEEGLGRLAAWQLAPRGLLGQLRMAFLVPLREDDSYANADLEVQAVNGDPHEYVSELGRSLALTLTGIRRPVLAVSATAFLPGAAATHVHRSVSWMVPDEPDAPVTMALRHVVDVAGDLVRISGSVLPTRDASIANMGTGLWTQYLRTELDRLAADPIQSRRARVLVVANSYAQIEDLASGMIAAGCPPASIAVAVPERRRASGRTASGGRVEVPISRLAQLPFQHPDVKVVLAPMARVSRGLNLVNSDGTSAVSSIWLAVRPVPLVDEPHELLAHAGAHARWTIRPGQDYSRVLQQRRDAADKHLRAVLNSPPQFSRLPPTVRLDLAATVLVDLIQLLGRARRGGTSAELNLVDGAFAGGPDGRAGWPTLIANLRDRWQRNGELDLLRLIYGGTLDAVLRLADDAPAMPLAPAS